MATLFASALKSAASASKRFRYGDVELRDWFRDKALRASGVDADAAKIRRRTGARQNRLENIKVGKMVMFAYDAKHKATLPYWDKFPVIFAIEQYSDGFLGINLHYLPPVYRARLMDALYTLLTDTDYDDQTRLLLSYKILAAASKFRYFKPCIKRYLTSHIKSHMIEIDVKEWDYAMFLPLAQFQKAGQQKVWDDSVTTVVGK